MPLLENHWVRYKINLAWIYVNLHIMNIIVTQYCLQIIWSIHRFGDAVGIYTNPSSTIYDTISLLSLFRRFIVFLFIGVMYMYYYVMYAPILLRLSWQSCTEGVIIIVAVFSCHPCTLQRDDYRSDYNAPTLLLLNSNLV